jgi:alpha-L-fucosidase
MSEKTYKNNIESLKEHKFPEWFDDSKFGLMVCWGLYSVPAWAPLVGDIDKIVKEGGWEKMFENNPYAEWYLNTMKIDGSPTQKHHYKTYGKDFRYEQFAPIFNKAIEKWQPDKWAEIFKGSGARYIVLVTKHCDSFLPWPSNYPHPYKENYMGSRDIVGELTDAVRAHDMIMGLYYCGGMDWTFSNKVVRTHYDVYSTIPQSKEYNKYINYHWRELIDKYKPSLLWGDIGWPDDSDPLDLFAYYYNSVPDGVINDRFAQLKNIPKEESDVIINPPSIYYDFRTPEYNTFEDKSDYKWELCRGIGSSFGYNQNETDKHYMSVDNLVHLLADVVSKNGNLLLNVGPKADGTIPKLQEEHLIGLGRWLDINGDAIYGTHPWSIAEGKTVEGIDVRFTQKPDTLYAILTQRKLDTGSVTIKSLKAKNNTKINLLGNNYKLRFQQVDRGLKIILPDNIETGPAYVLKITPQPELA